MFSSLDRIDIVTQNEETGRKSFLQTDHRPAAEIQQHRELSTLFALTRVLNARLLSEPEEVPVDVLYVCMEPPPDFLSSAVTSAGGRIQVNDQPVSIYEGPIGTPEDLAEEAFRRLAYRVAQSHDASLDEDFLVALQRQHSGGPGPEEDETLYWIRVAELAAVAGELLRDVVGGRWVDAPQMATLPFAFRIGAEGPSAATVNVVGKAERFLRNGERDSLVNLVHMAKDHALQGTRSGTVMVALKSPRWGSRDKVLHKSLFEGTLQEQAPLLVYGEDLPNSFAIFVQEGAQAHDLDALHAQALENLKAVEVEIEEVKGPSVKVLAVSGHYFAAEKVLDVAFMRSMHAHLQSPLLFAGVPRKGLLLLMSGLVDPSLTAQFIRFCQAEHQNPSTEPISPTPLIIQEGEIKGFAQVNDAPDPPPAGSDNRFFERKN